MDVFDVIYPNIWQLYLKRIKVKQKNLYANKSKFKVNVSKKENVFREKPNIHFLSLQTMDICKLYEFYKKGFKH